MKILAIDTSHPVGSATIADGGDVLLSETFGSAQSHVVELGRLLSARISSCIGAVSDIQRVALVVGPGSFTGLRVGMAYVKGLYASTRVDVVIMNTLQLLALGVTARSSFLCSMVDARRDEVYAALYRVNPGAPGPGAVDEVGAPCATNVETYVPALEMPEVCFVGSGARRYRRWIEENIAGRAEFAPEERHRPSTDCLARIAGDMQPLTHDEIVALEPFYIRASDAKLKEARGTDQVPPRR